MLTTSAADNFMCNKCNAKLVKPPTVQSSAVAKEQQHTYLHTLVRCKAECGHEHEVSPEERIATLEEKVDLMDKRMSRIEGNISKLHTMLGDVLYRLGKVTGELS